jgi:glutathione synthase/RimK-type ligase-like ATP-grasp enzyme
MSTQAGETMKKVHIGILTWRNGKRFAEPGYFSRLIKEGRRLGCVVFMFSPQDVIIPRQILCGYALDSHGDWQVKEFDWPDAVIDRYRNLNPQDAFRKYAVFREQTPFLYANNRIGNKWTVFEALHKDERMRRWLPETKVYHPDNLRDMLARHSTVYVKPVNGTGGRGILRIERITAGYLALGHTRQRNRKRADFRSEVFLVKWVKRWVKEQTHIVQQGLNLSIAPPSNADMRLLIQKNGLGTWSVTGFGMRVGQPSAAINNLHGGGKAIPAGSLLTPIFGVAQTESILQECQRLAHITAENLENRYGRLIELGLDIGIDPAGQIWLIEVNPKPGRDIFRQLGKPDVYRQSVRSPLQYALHLVQEHTASS